MQVIDLVRFMSEMLEVTVCDEELCACCFLRQRPKPQLNKKIVQYFTAHSCRRSLVLVEEEE